MQILDIGNGRHYRSRVHEDIILQEPVQGDALATSLVSDISNHVNDRGM